MELAVGGGKDTVQRIGAEDRRVKKREEIIEVMREGEGSGVRKRDTYSSDQNPDTCKRRTVASAAADQGHGSRTPTV